MLRSARSRPHLDGAVMGRPSSSVGQVTLANAGEVLVSRTVRDLVVGSELGFTDRGMHTLKGVPEPWQVYEVAGATG